MGYQPLEEVLIIDAKGNKTDAFKELGFFEKLLAKKLYKRNKVCVYFGFNSLGDRKIYQRLGDRKIYQ